MPFRKFSQKEQIRNTYIKMLKNQNIKYVKDIINLYNRPPFINKSIEEMIDRLGEIIDESDPDTDSSQLIHCIQTANSIENKIYSPSIYSLRIKDIFKEEEWLLLDEQIKRLYPTNFIDLYNFDDFSWIILTGFIHDLGKVLVLPELGKLDQWSVVGDTFPLGVTLDPNFPYSDCIHNNKDLSGNNYPDECGFEQMIFSWGHDEYFAQVLERSKTTIPPEAIYLVRFHSFYSWHTPRNGIRGYTKYASKKDWLMLPLLKFFSQSDLYSKGNYPINIAEGKKKFQKLYQKYFNEKNLKW